MKKPYAEDANYWETSKYGSDKWIDLTHRQIKALGGKVTTEGFGSDADGRAAFMMGFEIDGESFRVIWPVLTSKRGDIKSARVQAATCLYHYVKSTCLYAVVVGGRAAFFSHLVLPDGRVAAQVATNDLLDAVPQTMLLGSGR